MKDIKKQNLVYELMEYRFENDLSQQQIADALGMERYQLSNWENGKALPNGRSMHKIQKFLDSKKAPN